MEQDQINYLRGKIVSLKRVVVAGKVKGSPDDDVSPVFGRCGAFCVVDFTDGGVKTSTVISNPAFDHPGSAGVIAADSVVKLGADAVVAGDFGTASTEIFYKSGVKQYIIRDSTIKEAVSKMMSGEGICVDCKSIIASKRYNLGKKSITVRPGQGFENNGSYICKNCGCTMPKKEELSHIHCPNCGNLME